MFYAILSLRAKPKGELFTGGRSVAILCGESMPLEERLLWSLCSLAMTLALGEGLKV